VTGVQTCALPILYDDVLVRFDAVVRIDRALTQLFATLNAVDTDHVNMVLSLWTIAHGLNSGSGGVYSSRDQATRKIVCT
jgi:hypothetical protein